MNILDFAGQPSEVISDPWVQRVIIDATKEASTLEIILVSVASTVIAAGILYLIKRLFKKC